MESGSGRPSRRRSCRQRPRRHGGSGWPRPQRPWRRCRDQAGRSVVRRSRRRRRRARTEGHTARRLEEGARNTYVPPATLGNRSQQKRPACPFSTRRPHDLARLESRCGGLGVGAAGVFHEEASLVLASVTFYGGSRVMSRLNVGNGRATGCFWLSSQARRA